MNASALSIEPREARRGAWVLTLAHAALVATLAACDTLLTEPPVDADVMDAPVPGLSPSELAVFARGDAQFERPFSAVEGLGPIFNDRACAGCHSGDGRGRPENILVRIGVAPDFARALGGPQIQDRAVAGAHIETVPEGVPMSRRLPPPVFGVGLIEAIPEATILENADPNDEDGDGISGRPNWVEAAEWVPYAEPGGGTGPRLGRFSRKAQVSSLLQQTVEAYHQDMGITTDFLPLENENLQGGPRTSGLDAAPDPEVRAAEVAAVIEYIRMLAPPAPAQVTGICIGGRLRSMRSDARAVTRPCSRPARTGSPRFRTSPPGSTPTSCSTTWGKPSPTGGRTVRPPAGSGGPLPYGGFA